MTPPQHRKPRTVFPGMQATRAIFFSPAPLYLSGPRAGAGAAAAPLRRLGPGGGDGLAVGVIGEVPVQRPFLAGAPRKERGAVVHEGWEADLTHPRIDQNDPESFQLGQDLAHLPFFRRDVLVELVAAGALGPGQRAALAIQPVLLEVHPGEGPAVLQDV